jgi:hypothetical protein
MDHFGRLVRPGDEVAQHVLERGEVSSPEGLENGSNFGLYRVGIAGLGLGRRLDGNQVGLGRLALVIVLGRGALAALARLIVGNLLVGRQRDAEPLGQLDQLAVGQVRNVALLVGAFNSLLDQQPLGFIAWIAQPLPEDAAGVNVQ